MNQFDKQLAIGKAGESQIARWFLSLGFSVLPVYEKETGDYKGPVIHTANQGQKVAPDMLIFKENKIFWIEAKHKSAFTWHRKTSRWVTGIDIHHYNDYLSIAESIDIPVWLLFLHKPGVAKDTPESFITPTGLFGNDLHYLKNNINHIHENGGKYGMVYWSVDKLKKIASLTNFYERCRRGS